MRSGALILTSIFIFCATVVCLDEPATAVTLPFEDGFENIAVGDYPNENGWTQLFSGKSAYVTDAIAHTGTKSFRLDSHPNWARMDYVKLEEIPDRLTYEVSVYVDPSLGRYSYVGFMKGVSNQGGTWNRFVVMGSEGQVRFHGAPSVDVFCGSYSSGTWCTVRADLDFVNLKARLWLDGELIASNVAIRPKEFDDPSMGHVVMDKWGVVSTNYSSGSTNVVYFDDIKIRETEEVLYAQSVLHEIGGWANVGDLVGPPDGQYAYTANSLEQPWAGASSSAGSAVWLDFGRIVHSGTIVVYHDDPGGHYTDLVAGPWYGFCPSVPYPVPLASDVATLQGNIQGSGTVTCYTTPLDFRYVRLDHFTLDSSLQDGIDAVAVIEGVPSDVGIDLVPPPAIEGPVVYAAGQSNNGYWNNPGELLGSPDGVYAWSANPGHTMPYLVVDIGRVVCAGTIVMHHDKTHLSKSSLGVSINSQEYDPDPDTCPAWPGTDGWELLWTGHAKGVTTLQFPPTYFRYIQFGQSHCGGQEDGIDAIEVYESPLSVGTISGTVTFDGIPLSDIPVYLLPAMEEGQWNNQFYDNLAAGFPDNPSNYALEIKQTENDGYYEFDGITVGEYEVAICPTNCQSELELRRADLAGSGVTVDFEMWGIDKQYNVAVWGSYPKPSDGESTVITYWIEPSLNSAWQKAIKYALELWSQISRNCDGVSVPYLQFAASPKDVADIRFLTGSLPANSGGKTSRAGFLEWLAHMILFKRNLLLVVFNTDNLDPILAFGTDESPEPVNGGINKVGSETRWVQYYLDDDIGSQMCKDQVFVAVHEVGHAIGLGEAPDIRQYSIMRSENWDNMEWDRFLGWGDICGIHKLYASAATQSALAIIATCPVNLLVQDPLGRIIDKWQSFIPDSWYSEVDQDGDESPDDTIVLDAPIDGVYTIQVNAEFTLLTDTETTFSLYVCGADGSTQLASETPISYLPREYWIARQEGDIAYDSALFEPPITNAKFTLKNGRAIPIKFHVVDCLGAIVTEQRNISLEVTGPAPDGETSTYIFSLADGTLKFDPVESPPHYVAIFKTRTYPVVDGKSYTATVKEDGASIGSITLEVKK